jgi:hypothetical protein
MADLDSIAPQFRLAMERWPEAPTPTNHYKAVAECYAGSGGQGRSKIFNFFV